jgi:predicted nucleotidyltransferase
MDRQSILHYLKEIKPKYAKEGFIIEGLFGSYARNEAREQSDIDILVHTEPAFTQRYGSASIARFNEIKEELSVYLKTPVDLASSSGMGKIAKKFIIDRTIYI